MKTIFFVLPQRPLRSPCEVSPRADLCGENSSSAFTLIELLLVIVLMAIIIGISTPMFIGMGRGAGMRGSVRAVCSTLSLLRQWAITHREQVTFVYFQGADPGTATNASYYYATASGVLIEKTNELPMEVIFDGDGSINFKTDGGLDTTTTIPIVIYDRQSKTAGGDVKKTIKITGLTGGIHVE
jgi:prepilin-type N-terminal cleavage/methylation domain-containing protein